MSIESKIKYYPALSVADNAKINGVSEDAIRYYIRTRGVDRRYAEKMKVLKSMQDYLDEHPNATKAEVARQSGRGINTVVRYWDILQGRTRLEPNARKTETHEQTITALNKRQIAYLDKLPVEFIREYLKARSVEEKKARKKREQEEQKTIAIQEIKSRIDTLVENEHENTLLLEQYSLYLPKITKEDLYRREKTKYDITKYRCIAFRKKGDMWKNWNVDLGNMNGGFPFSINGITFPTSEHAYIFGIFSHNTKEHLAIQKQLLENPNGYIIKKAIRYKNIDLWRADWNEFNVEWMLFVVWQKAVQNKEFQSILKALPQHAHIIEDVSFKAKDDNSADFWGARNPSKTEFGSLVAKYVKHLDKDDSKIKQNLLWDYCNVGVYEGFNVMGKILTYVKQCLHDGIEPNINYELLSSKNIFILGKPVSFDNTATKQQSSIVVPLTAEDISPAEQSKRAAAVLLNKATNKAQGKNVILDGVELKYEEYAYPIDDVILYSSKVEPENRMLGHHYECLITFRGVEFYGVEQMHSALKFNERPYILNDIMTAESGVQAKDRSHKYAKMYLYDSDYNLKDARITALCFLFKYLSVKEYRDRLRELRGKTLFENKGSYEGGNRMNADKTMLIGNNGDGRSMMAVRDMMLRYEDAAIAEVEQMKGRSLTDAEREEVLNGVLATVRAKFENDPQVKADSDNVIEYIKTHTDIIPLRRYWPGEDAKAIIFEFDNCVFDTSADDEVRKAKGAKITNWNKFYKEYIPQYKLHDGWRKVFEWADANGVLIGVLGKAKTDLVRRTFEANEIRCDAIEYASNASRQHGYDIIDGLKIRPEQVLCYISGSKQGVQQAKESGFRFIGATWNAKDIDALANETTINNPADIIDILNSTPTEQKIEKPLSIAKQSIKDNLKCTDRHVYFFQDTPLSNWWKSTPAIPYDGHHFNSSEALFMYLKAKGMGDDEIAMQIVEVDNNASLADNKRFAKVKALGRKCKFDEAIYLEKREEWMFTTISAKYEVDEEFRSVLMSDKYKGLTFVEASPFDAVWGIKTTATKKVLSEGESAWNGLNLLGKLLTKLRDEKLK